MHAFFVTQEHKRATAFGFDLHSKKRFFFRFGNETNCTFSSTTQLVILIQIQNILYSK